MLYLASQIVKAGHISQGIKILFVTAIPVTTFATFGITVVVLIASIDTWHTNSVSYFSSFVMSKTLCWTSQHFWTVWISSTQFQRLWVWCLEKKEDFVKSGNQKPPKERLLTSTKGEEKILEYLFPQIVSTKTEFENCKKFKLNSM